ncbi:MAG: tetratricopeptide repeat protein [Chitinophagales bacterium]
MNNSRIEQLLIFLSGNPKDSFVKFALALEYAKLGDDEKTLSYFKEILADDPDYCGTYYHLGKLYEKLNKKEKAEETYKEGLKRSMGKEQKTYQELQEALNQLLFEE